MNRRGTKRAAWCIWLGSFALASPCEAGPLFDWLFQRQPQAVTAGYAPAPGSNCGAGYCEQTVLQYVPQVAYRTVWEAVPVTTYRRTVSYNPANGLPMTCTQPCTSYTYQPRRVPYTTFRPVYATVPVSAPAPATYAAPAAVAPLAPTPGCNCGAGGGYQAPATQPYYTTPSPAGATPWMPLPRGGAVPPSEMPRSNVPIDPADEAPRIDPGLSSDPNDGASTLPRIPGNRSSELVGGTNNGYSTVRGYRDDYYRRPTEWMRMPAASPPPNSSPAPLLNSRSGQWRSDDSSPSGLSNASPAPAPFSLQPIPNLDSRSDARSSTNTMQPLDDTFRGPDLSPPDRNEAPALINEPRDRTALIQPIPTRWAANRIEWPEQRASYEVEDKRPMRQAIHRTESDRRLDTRRAPVPELPEAREERPSEVDGWRISPRRSTDDGWRLSN